MRLTFLFAAAALALSGTALAQTPDAQSAFVERRALLLIDQRCGLLTAPARLAVEASALQARGAMLRAGWTSARMSNLERAIDGAARERACTDERTQTAAADAREAYNTWAVLGGMDFPGWSRSWTARRTTGANGWRLSQAIDTPVRATFGVREIENAQRLTLIVPERRESSAQLVMRDRSRSAVEEIPLPTRIAYGVSAGAPGPGAHTRSFPSTRIIERRSAARGEQTVFVFSDEAFRALLALDPRESIAIDLVGGRVTQRLYVEVGDIAAARAFLAARPAD